MATLKDIRKRITSVKNTQKITKAMKMVAAAKLRRAQSALLQARPYGGHLRGILRRTSAYINPESTPFLAQASSGKAALLVFSSDRGLCGGFNSNLLRRVNTFLYHEGKAHESVQIQIVGKKARDFFRARKVDIEKEWQGIGAGFSFENALETAQQILQGYLDGEFSNYYIAYNGFKSAISQEIRIQKILPLDFGPAEEGSGIFPIIFEPSAERLFEEILPRYLASEIYLAYLESTASELGARMSAMENATSNAKEMIGKLTLAYNRARQATITKELMDIVNGAESLK